MTLILVNGFAPCIFLSSVRLGSAWNPSWHRGVTCSGIKMYRRLLVLLLGDAADALTVVVDRPGYLGFCGEILMLLGPQKSIAPVK